jgi:hypothetical protein
LEQKAQGLIHYVREWHSLKRKEGVKRRLPFTLHIPKTYTTRYIQVPTCSHWPLNYRCSHPTDSGSWMCIANIWNVTFVNHSLYRVSSLNLSSINLATESWNFGIKSSDLGIPRWRLEVGSRKWASYSEIL